MTDQISTDEDVLVEYADIIREATMENLAPNWTLDLVHGGLEPESLRMMAARWLDYGFEPADFAGRVDALADAVQRASAGLPMPIWQRAEPV